MKSRSHENALPMKRWVCVPQPKHGLPMSPEARGCGHKWNDPMQPMICPACLNSRTLIEMVRWRGDNKPKATKPELIALLRIVEAEMTKAPAFNKWDLGPSRLLIDVREALGFPNPEEKGQHQERP